MSTISRLKKVEAEINKTQEEVNRGHPIVEMTPEQKLSWPKNLPYPIFGGFFNK